MSPRFLGSLCRDLDLNCLVYYQVHEFVKTLLHKLAVKLLVIMKMCAILGSFLLF